MPKFSNDSLVVHVKSGKEYRIVEGPDTCALEATRKPAYAYRGEDGILWVREAIEMEDGRFKFVE